MDETAQQEVKVELNRRLMELAGINYSLRREDDYWVATVPYACFRGNRMDLQIRMDSLPLPYLVVCPGTPQIRLRWPFPRATMPRLSWKAMAVAASFASTFPPAVRMPYGSAV